MKLKPSSDFRITDFDHYLFGRGEHYEIYNKLGAHLCQENDISGTLFQVWAPFAKSVRVIHDMNSWNPDADFMTGSDSGVWALFIPGIGPGCKYKFVVEGCDGKTRYKADPYAFQAELRPNSASIVVDPKKYKWTDKEFLKETSNKNTLKKPMAIYEVHLGSWKKDYRLNEDGFLDYRRLADELSEYVDYMGFTHVELIGICEHPLDASWGYQVTGYYAPTSRYGSPEDFKYFVNKMHEKNIGVILDWVPAHFPKDSFGLEQFDGSALYEYADPLRAEYPEWGTKAFDHGKPQVQCFLISNALYWINEFHIDALRVDAVASMLYTSFSRAEYRPNIYGGTENLESIAFLKKINKEVKARSRGFLIAEDSSIMSGITSDTEGVALGFMYKWNMGWMNDTLKYVEKEPIYRGWHHGAITHNADYAFLENYMLVLSHDEVVHLKHSMLEKFPGNEMDKMGGLKTLYAHMLTFPGKKLLFMGQEFGEDKEWSEEREISWHLASDYGHRDIMLTLRELLRIYKTYPVLYDDTSNPTTFEWVNNGDCYRNTFSYIRRNPWNYNNALLVIINFSPMNHNGYTCGAPVEGYYKRIFSTFDQIDGNDAEKIKDIPPLTTEEHDCDGYKYMLTYDLRPYETAIFELPIVPEESEKPKRKRRTTAKKKEDK